MSRVAVALLALALAACEAKPAPIAYGHDECAYCRMTITDPRFGAELVTRRGRVYKFDSIECLAGFVASGQVPAGDVHSLWVTDFAHPPQLIPAREARYLRSIGLRSPMGLNLAGFARASDLENARTRYGGAASGWDRILTEVRESRFLERRSIAPGPPRPR
jgi:copper chaperone NosL